MLDKTSLEKLCQTKYVPNHLRKANSMRKIWCRPPSSWSRSGNTPNIPNKLRVWSWDCHASYGYQVKRFLWR